MKNFNRYRRLSGKRNDNSDNTLQYNDDKKSTRLETGDRILT